MDNSQQQTSETFDFKWKKRDSYESEHFKKKTYNWLVERYFGSEEGRRRFLEEHRDKHLLDAGCGSGFTAGLLFGRFLNDINYLGVDISDAVDVARERFSESGIKGRFAKENIETMKLDLTFDVIYCEGVIHHTSDPYATFQNLVSHLKKGGIIMFYIYKKKSPVREFTDDFIREKIRHLSNNEAWEALKPLSKLGKIVGDLDIEVEIDEDIELLGIPQGRYNLQRLFYYNFLKIYYDKNYSLEEMNHINFDWFRPLNCFRFSPAEIKEWLVENKLTETRFIVEDSGITAVARKD